ncbi:MAG: hypothetical protein JKY19_12440, partial [Alcanivoracaceae bacterium]|nr:hypothetical protein [Alcanivoracaceae bacterium]
MTHHKIKTKTITQEPDFWTKERIASSQPLDALTRNVENNEIIVSPVDEPFSKFKNENFNNLPNAAMGRLQAKTPYGDSFSSAQFVHPKVLLTARHCVMDEQNKPFSRITFLHQYNGDSYKELFNITNTFYPSKSLNTNIDYAFCLVDKKFTGKYLKILQAPNKSTVHKNIVNLGYPSNFSGRLACANGAYSYDVNKQGRKVTFLTKEQFTMWKGASGGAWVVN